MEASVARRSRSNPDPKPVESELTLEFPAVELPAKEMGEIRKNVQQVVDIACQTEKKLQAILDKTSDPAARKEIMKALRACRVTTRLKAR
jgi:hypothetical protein